jgi:superfamily I DNA/RNA helicase/RecB family exonuclease
MSPPADRTPGRTPSRNSARDGCRVVTPRWWNGEMPRVELSRSLVRAPEPPPDTDQAVVIARVAEADGRSLLVVGGPGSGKSTLAIALAVDAVRSSRLAPEDVLVLAPTRVAATALRDRLSHALGVPTSEPPVRTAASVAWGILRLAATREGRPSPVLVSGAEQDQIIGVLLAGHREGRVAGPTWTGIVPTQATELAGFRAELRDLIMRAEEAGKGPVDLRRLGEEWGRPEWVAAAAVFAEYEATMGLRAVSGDQGERYDPAGIVSAAADRLASWPSGETQPSWGLVIVDDAQDITHGAWDLLRLLARAGSRVVLLGNADESVQGYRGAIPHVVADAVLDPPIGFGATLISLGSSHRQGSGPSAVAERAASRIGTAQGFSARGVSGGSIDDRDESIEVILSPHGVAEARALAARLRDLHRGEAGVRVRWSDMAIVARTRARAAEVRSNLMNAGIPCARLGEGVALHRQPAVAPLLRLMRVALGDGWTVESSQEVLSSRAIGVDGPGIRRLKRQLVMEERSGGGRRLGDDLLVDALADPARLTTIATRESARASVAASAARAGAIAARVPGATASTVLWALWKTLGVAEVWRDAAIEGSTNDDADLDAVVALFRAAGDYEERLPEAPPGAFLDYLEGQAFAVDTLAAGGATGDVVAFETPASAAGREWDVVAIAGLEEGVWPNLALRDSVLGAGFLADVLAGRATPRSEGETTGDADLRARRAGILDDETRAFLVSITRAKRRVIALSREGVNERPSRYLALLGDGIPVRRASEVGGLSDLREAVAVLRAEAANLDSHGRAGHAEMLAHLVLAGIPGADPATWYGAHDPSSTEPLWRRDERVRVSPSKVERIESCPLRAVLESAGGTSESGSAQRIGTLVHAAAAENPQGPAEAVMSAIEARWPELGLRDNWWGSHLKARVAEMADRFAEYASGASHEGWDVRTEVPFAVEIGNALLSGRADRLHVRDGEARIVDLKTGTQATPKKEVEANPQLAMYQVAANTGGFPGVATAVGAELVFLGAGGDYVRRQGAAAAKDGIARLGAIVDTLCRADFDAILSKDCRTCPVRRSCPAQAEGGRVTEA